MVTAGRLAARVFLGGVCVGLAMVIAALSADSRASRRSDDHEAARVARVSVTPGTPVVDAAGSRWVFRDPAGTVRLVAVGALLIGLAGAVRRSG
jgi:hypothetical protein